MTELRNRGVRDIFIACVDGLKGFPEAIEAVFSKTEVQVCVVHMIRGSLRFVSWQDRKAVIADLRVEYQAEISPKKTWNICRKMGQQLSYHL
jgi:putative transposase